MSKILIVDDSPLEIKIIRRLLGTEYEVFEAASGQEAIEATDLVRPDLILLDIIMDGMDGLTVCKILKSKPETAVIPIIFITSVSESQGIVKGFEAGGQDYITKPFYAPELCARIKVHLDLKHSKETILQYAKELEAKNQALNQMLKKIETAAMTDCVTGLANRWSTMRWFKSETTELKRDNAAVTLILADIDNFKQINDNYGHDCGDEVLKRIAGLMQSVVRDKSVIARWGGEEFLLILSNASQTVGRIVAERIRKTIESATFSYQDKSFSITLTLGVAKLDPDAGLEASIKKADEALYKGKYMGKNRVVVYE